MFLNKLHSENTIRIIDAPSISSLLHEKESLIINRVCSAYEKHYQGLSSLPHSVFLKFSEKSRNRIIGLPAFLDGEEPSAGFKWIASFPNNHQRSLDRASALMILNDMETGFPKAVMEASIISAKRTAASATLATLHLYHDDMESIAMIGCGLIGFEIIKFIKAMHPSLKKLYVHDLSTERAEHFIEKLQHERIDIQTYIVDSIEELFASSPVVALATTSPTPYILKPELIHSTKLILNISLRDLSPEIILAGINIVDDIDHVCRERTSIHLTEMLVGNRDFIHCTLAEITKGKIDVKMNSDLPIIFSPFGLGVLDLSIAEYVFEECCEQVMGYALDGFFPTTWHKSPKNSKHSLSV